MTVRITRVLTYAERRAMEDEAVAKGWYRNDRRMFTPGMAWHEPFYWRPDHWPEKPNWGTGDRSTLCQRGDPFLSVHYWRDWADKRPPIALVLPNGEVWEIDRKSSNGDGWLVTGDLLEPRSYIAPPNITVSPSILAKGYHGFLKAGQFTADCDRPGHPDGVWPYPET